MTPEDCLLKIMEDCDKFDTDLLDSLPEKRRKREIGLIVDRWLKWMGQVNKPEWEVGEEE